MAGQLSVALVVLLAGYDVTRFWIVDALPLQHSAETYGTAYNPDNPFIYPVPFAIHALLGLPHFNRTHGQFNEPHMNMSRVQIGQYFYHNSQECGAHFLNQGEGFIIDGDNLDFDDESDRCTWAFVGNRFCTPSMECTEYAAKRNSDCTTSYLQVTDGGDSFVHHFCDSQYTPLQRNITATRGILDITYRFTGGKRVAFRCLVRCVPYLAEYEPKLQPKAPVKEKLSKDEVPVRKSYNLPQLKMGAKCRCGEPNGFKNRIVGGRQTIVSQYPWMVGIMNTGRRLPFCGGSLINDRYVLTAAHCLEDETLDDLVVVLNEHDFDSRNETHGLTIKARVAEIIPYQYYLESTFYGDIALLRLAESVNISSFVLTPLCLPTEETQKYEGKEVIGAGWGTLKEQGNKSTTLQEVIMRVYDNAACNDYHSVDMRFPPQVMDNMLCAGYSEGGRDTCSGDSGGPLFTWEHKRKRFHQIGVTSWGFGCGQKLNPGVFTRVNCKYLSL